MSNQADVCMLTTEAVIDHCGKSSQMGPNVATSLKNLEAVKTKQLITRPTKPTKAQVEADPSSLTECELNCDDCEEERKQVNKENEHLALGL